MKIFNILDDAQDNGLTQRALAKLRDAGNNMDVWQYGISDIDGNEKYFSELVDNLDNSYLTIIRMHAGTTYFKKFDRLKEVLQKKGISTLVESEMPQDMTDNRSLFLGSQEDYVTLRSYIEIGGDDNEYNMLAWMLRDSENVDIEVAVPKRKDAQGLYLPGNGIVDSVPFIKGRPTIGILMSQIQVLGDNCKHFDSLIRKLQSNGMNTIPVFLTPNPNDITGSIGINGCVRKYLMHDNVAIVDAVIVTMGFSMLCMSDPGDGASAVMENIFEELGVPVIQSSALLGNADDWKRLSGFGPFEISMNVFWPEFDGQIISVPFASNERSSEGRMEYTAIEDRIETVAKLAGNWATLKRTPASERRIAILLHQNPPRNDMIGAAFGLDTPQSTVNLLNSMRSRGYDMESVPENGQELVSLILKGVSNDTEWLSADEMRKRAAAIVKTGTYAEWFSSLNDTPRTKMIDDWGNIPGEINTIDGGIAIPGIVNGNIFIGLQPDRGMGDESQDIYHSQDISMPHNYLAYYRWLIDDFKAQAVIHMGCHGTAEWLPGKGTALSSDCYPDIVLNGIPHIYPYAISNPGEGVHAKRRSGAVIVDHMIPAQTRADGYTEITEIESLLQEYLRAETAGQQDKGNSILYDVFDNCRKIDMLDDIGLTQHSDIDELRDKAEDLYDYICRIKDSTIKDGLHVLGMVPSGRRLTEMVYTLTRIDNGNIPSLRNSVASVMNIDLGNAMSSPSAVSNNGVLNGELIDLVDEMTFGLVEKMNTAEFDTQECVAIADTIGTSGDLITSIKFICETLVPLLKRIDEETENLINALDGKFILPGPSGCPTRGNVHLLPTGRNFYSIDPAAIPTRSSWDTGVKMADQMIERHVADNGVYPRQIGIVVWATDTMKTGGDDIAYILWLLGVRPTWSATGSSVTGLEIIPQSELKRPRIDVTLRISGLFRDSFPNLVEMIDDAVQRISELDESDEENYLLANLRKDVADSIADGMDREIARKGARIRIFGDPPGNYGGGVDVLIENSSWQDRSDLGEAFVEWGGYAYGREYRGEDVKDFFRKRLQGIEVTVKNHESRELDAFDNDDDFVFLGGMNAAVESQSGKQPLSVIGDSSDPSRPSIRSLEEEGKFIYRSRVLNPKWIDGLKEHGYRGVQELANLVDFSFGWDSTSGIMEDWMYQSVTERFLFDGENKQWIEENNPDALRKITSRLLEAVERGMWNTDSDTVERLRSMFLDSEGLLENLNDS